MHRRTPCVGICSTTYGDLVCRGCKRYAHEIVSWNAYTDEQRAQIEARLRTLKLGVLRELIAIADVALARQQLPGEQGDGMSDSDLLVALYDLWRRRPQVPADEMGLHPAGVRFAQVRERFDAESYRRAQALYEHSFKVAPV